MIQKGISVLITAGMMICSPEWSFRFLVPNVTSWRRSGREIKSRKRSTFAASILLQKIGLFKDRLTFPSADHVLSCLVNAPFGKAGYHLLEFDATKIVCKE